MIELKSYFLEIPNRYPTLGKWKKEFVEFLTYIAINSLNGYTIGDLKRAFKLLPVDGIEFAAKSLYRILNNSNNESADVSTYWENKIRPFWKNVWPKSKNLISEKASESLALFCVASMNKFHDALDYTQSWIKRIKHPVVVVEKLSKSGLCKKFPEDSLKLLYLTIGEDYCYPMIELPECLKEISEVAAELKATRAYKRLEEYVERNK